LLSPRRGATGPLGRSVAVLDLAICGLEKSG
jgi:hypothetical protein